MASKSFLTREEVRDIYDKQARIYDLAVWFYYLAGMRIDRWRRMAVDALSLRPGDTVVEIGCGTGLNFSLLERAVGDEGKIIGMDISEAMLDRARKRVRTAGWRNVELVCAAASDFSFPDGIGGILATGVLTYESEFDKVIKRGARALAPGRRWVVLDYKMPNNWLRCLVPVFVALGSSFGVSKSFMERHVWESVERHLTNTRMEELYGGFVYIVSGEAS
ncbi:MAG: class I SAM-dependent methyltransferase [Gammaproteobacteria bacterium]|nr:class I SAM-dependent methyltransferase [Gammaproteobacteria bacterium]